MSSELQVIEKIRDILKQTWIPEQTIDHIEKEIDTFYSSRYGDIIRSCTSCPLHEGCKQQVPGSGPMPADIMFVGEAPGENEDEQGLPFVGPAGQLLNKIIESAGWDRNDIYITNVIKCRPPDNRQPTKAEVVSCYKHLQKEIELVKPKVIVCWGAVASNVLIHPEFKITQEHGHWFEDKNDRRISCFHPAYILRLGSDQKKMVAAKRAVWEAIQKVKRYQDQGFKDGFR